MPGETLLANKPYDFVPLVEKAVREQLPPHDRLDPRRLSGRLDLELEVLTPLYISQGEYRPLEDNSDLLAAFTRRDGVTVIPGSSLKGVVRSLAEAVSYSCAPRLPAREDLLSKALPPGNKYTCDGRENQACITCRLFGFSAGNNSYRGQVSFGEFRQAEPGAVTLKTVYIPFLQSPFRRYPVPNPPFREKGEYGNERLYYCAICPEDSRDCYHCHKEDYSNLKRQAGPGRRFRFRGRKFYFHSLHLEEGRGYKYRPVECLAPGSRLQGQVFFLNLKEEELALLAFSLGLDGSFALKVGYGKPAYLGSARLHLLGVEWTGLRYGLEAEPGADPRELAHRYAREAPADLQERIAALRRILSWEHPGGRPWPVVNGNRVY